MAEIYRLIKCDNLITHSQGKVLQGRQRKDGELVRPSGRGTVHSRPHKIFWHFHDLWTLLNKIREGVALSPLSILHKTH